MHWANRVRWHLYRSPLAPKIKALRSRFAARALSKRRGLAQELPTGSEVHHAAQSIKRDGYAKLDGLIDPALLGELHKAGQTKLGQIAAAQAVRGVSRKPFWTVLLGDEMIEGRLPTQSIFVRFALQPAILSTISEAMGHLPQLDYVALTFSEHSDSPLAYSQLWHRDHDDTRTVKLFVYLTDVEGVADGPFTFLPGPVSDRVGYSLKSHRADEDIFQRVPGDTKLEMSGPALTAFAVQTSRCLHMGSRLAPGHKRLMYTATYISLPRLYPEPPPRFLLTGKESPLEQAVLTGRS